MKTKPVKAVYGWALIDLNNIYVPTFHRHKKEAWEHKRMYADLRDAKWVVVYVSLFPQKRKR